MMAMEYYDGTEHVVDIIIYDSKLIAAFITDSGMVRRPYFIATARRMPSFLSEDKQAWLIEAAYRCCLQIGLSDGTFNVEFKVTENGPSYWKSFEDGGYCLKGLAEEIVRYRHHAILYDDCSWFSPFVRTPPVDKVLMV
ncbi:carnosine synthase 1-like [Mercenaria mercenaria]|uniref:carnosine synthase 1-like n=1 Tax=Mercenaria mercenaria TaxID=6596 RepID=UPI00234E68D4|nr:carnosine synthase 1-like [Mercenaria mercenaria]